MGTRSLDPGNDTILGPSLEKNDRCVHIFPTEAGLA